MNNFCRSIIFSKIGRFGHIESRQGRLSVQGVKSLGGHFGVDFYEVKRNIVFQKEKGNNFTLLIIFIVKYSKRAK